MKKITFLMLVLIVNYAAYSQSEYGIFVKTIQPPAFPNGNLQLVKANHSIYIETNSLTLFTNVLGQTQYFEEFWTVNNNETDIYYSFEDSSDNNLCYQSGTINWNLLTEPSKIITGCIAETYLYVIHVTSTDALKSKCPEDVIELNNGWNWQYSFDGENWKDFAANFQAQRSISFKINELDGFENKTKLYFRAGFGTQFTNILPCDIIPCSPFLEIDPPLPLNPSCNNTGTGSIPLKFKSEIKNDEQLLLNLFTNANPLNPRFLLSKFVPKSAIINNEYTWTNIGAGNYIIRYQAQKTTDNTTDVNSSAVTTKAFSIINPPIFSFSATETQPKCYGEKGTIIITASGGTPPYYYYLNDDPKIEFTSPKTIDANAGDNYIKVVDSKSCIDNTKEDEKI